MCFLVTRDGTKIFYKDWGSGQPVVFVHGWPLSADSWDPQLMWMANHGHRVIAHDRRGHGRSEQTWDRNHVDCYADDLAALLETLDLDEVILVGHSLGAGEAVRYLARHGRARVAKLVLVSTITPLLIQSPRNPEGPPRVEFDVLRSELLRDRAQLFKNLAFPYYNANRYATEVSEGLRESFWRQAMLAGIKPIYDCIGQLSETDFHADLERVDVPTLIIHGDDDQLVAVEAAARRTAELIPDAILEVYADAPHGLPQTHVERFNADLLAFAQR